MKLKIKVVFFLIMIFANGLTYSQALNSESITVEEARQAVKDLELTGWNGKSDAGSAALIISRFRLKEAIPNLLKYYSRQEPIDKYYFLDAIASCEYKGAIQLFHNFIDSAEVYNLNPRRNYKAHVAVLLIELGDYTKRDVLYDALERDSTSYFATIAANVLDDLIINVPFEEAKAKEKLLNIARNSTDGFARWVAISNLYKVYMNSILPVLEERFVSDTTYSTRVSILEDMLAKVKTSETISFLKQQVFVEQELSIRNKILEVLLEKFSSPSMYLFISNNKSLMAEWEYKKIIEIDLHIFEARLDSNTTTTIGLDSLLSYHSQCASYNWLGNTTFSDQLKTYLTEAKTKLASGDSLGAALKIKIYQNQIVEQYKDTVKTDGKFVTEDGYKFLYYYPKYILERLPKLPAVKLNNSQGKLIRREDRKLIAA